jgi:hypothetical protein
VGTSVTITGIGFGSVQGAGVVWLGSLAAGQIVSWSNTQIVATVASGSVSGVAWVEQNDTWSNMLTFTVPGGSVTLVPNIINMLVGDTHTIRGTQLIRAICNWAELDFQQHERGHVVNR